jgi:hypothetical protein
LVRPIEIVVAGEAQLDTRGDKGMRQRIRVAQVGDVEGAADPVIARCPALVMLALLEVGQDIGEAPSLVPQGVPMIVVPWVAPRIDHGIDCTGATEDLALLKKVGNAAGMCSVSERSVVPASRRSTLVEASSVSRWASTHPAEPAPTMM